MKQQSLKEINKRLIIGNPLKIIWGDAHMGTSTPPELAEKLWPTESWGRLVMLTKETVVLTAWIALDPYNPKEPSENGAFKLITTIPRKCIYRVRIL